MGQEVLKLLSVIIHTVVGNLTQSQILRDVKQAQHLVVIFTIHITILEVQV